MDNGQPHITLNGGRRAEAISRKLNPRQKSICGNDSLSLCSRTTYLPDSRSIKVMGGQQQAANLHVRVHKFLVDARPIFGYWMVGEREAATNTYSLHLPTEIRE